MSLLTGDGISEMKVNPEKDAASWKGFEACMNNITKAIPEHKHKKTPLFLGATAGMRLLEYKHVFIGVDNLLVNPEYTILYHRSFSALFKGRRI